MTPPANVPFDEFQEFLKRIQVLRMSNATVAMNALDTVDETLPTNTNGSYQSQPRPAHDVMANVQHHSAPEILQISNRNDNWDGYMDADGLAPDNTWQYDRNLATTSAFQPPIMTSIKVTVGIDEDLKMILEMDPSIVDLGGTAVEEPKIIGLPPITGGYGIQFRFSMAFSSIR